MKYRVKFELQHEQIVEVEAEGIGKAIAAARASIPTPLGSVIGVERVSE